MPLRGSEVPERRGPPANPEGSTGALCSEVGIFDAGVTWRARKFSARKIYSARGDEGGGGGWKGTPSGWKSLRNSGQVRDPSVALSHTNGTHLNRPNLEQSLEWHSENRRVKCVCGGDVCVKRKWFFIWENEKCLKFRHLLLVGCQFIFISHPFERQILTPKKLNWLCV